MISISRCIYVSTFCLTFMTSSRKVFADVVFPFQLLDLMRAAAISLRSAKKIKKPSEVLVILSWSYRPIIVNCVIRKILTAGREI